MLDLADVWSVYCNEEALAQASQNRLLLDGSLITLGGVGGTPLELLLFSPGFPCRHHREEGL